MRFCTVINCMDGRVQLPVIKYMQERFDAEYVDSITEPSPSLLLSEEKNNASIQAILERLKLSVEKHNSVGIAVAGHNDCTANPAPEDDQFMHIRKAVGFLRRHYADIEIIGLCVDGEFKVHEVVCDK